MVGRLSAIRLGSRFRFLWQFMGTLGTRRGLRSSRRDSAIRARTLRLEAREAVGGSPNRRCWDREIQVDEVLNRHTREKD